MYEVTIKSGRAKTEPMVYKNIWELASLMESVLMHSTKADITFIVKSAEMKMADEEFDKLVEVVSNEHETV